MNKEPQRPPIIVEKLQDSINESGKKEAAEEFAAETLNLVVRNDCTVTFPAGHFQKPTTKKKRQT